MEKISLKVVVAGRSYPLTVSEAERERVLKAAEDINKAIHVLKDNYAVKDMQDLLAMAALQLATKTKGSTTVVEKPANYQEIENALDNLDSHLDSLL
ncbi:MAG: cell division protein ZapA [Crocinitomicaceae bacterium]|jgi:cell division protein ZapA|nr:cell division protein ZapA [Crocinitomicaceae bacterium]